MFKELIRPELEMTPVAPDVIFTFGNFPITNTVLFELLIILLFAIFGYVIVRKFTSGIPGRAQNGIEIIIENLRGFVQQITGSEELTRQIFPLIATLVTYITVANLIGFIPGLTSFTYAQTAILRTPTTDFNTTLGLAVAVSMIIQFSSIRDWGFFGYLGRFIKIKEIYLGFRKSLKDGAMAIFDFFLGLLDIFGEIAKIASLSFRLFGNIFAGEVLLVLLLGTLAYVLPSIWITMSLLFGLVQAVVFASLTAVYYTLAMKPREE